VPFVADNSVVVGWYFESQSTPYTDKVLDLLANETAHVPALQYGLTSYDAAYLGLAIRLQLPIATNDGALRQAAVSAGVGVI
jgi:hypothetical protein